MASYFKISIKPCIKLLGRKILYLQIILGIFFLRLAFLHKYNICCDYLYAYSQPHELIIYHRIGFEICPVHPRNPENNLQLVAYIQ